MAVTTEVLPYFTYPAEQKSLLARLQPASSAQAAAAIQVAVSAIIAAVRAEGDAALKRYTESFDKLSIPAGFKFRVTSSELLAAQKASLPSELKAAIAAARANIHAFHAHQLKAEAPAVPYVGRYGEQLSLRSTALAAVGIYVPGGSGGQTPLISTLLMNVIPAQLAGVQRIAVVSPPTATGTLVLPLLYTLAELGITEVYKIGGAQAIAALAYGTANIAPVHFISGPGNAYVTEAKRQVYGQVGIESLAGHSELVVLADGTLSARHAALELLAQAEHAGNEMACLITPSRSYAKAVTAELSAVLPSLSRRALIEQSFARRGACVIVKDLSSAYTLINAIAPEHLAILCAKPETALPHIHHAAAIFLGSWSSGPIGDYIAGSNHVLPTGSAARFASPLSVAHFRKQNNIIKYTREAFTHYAPHAATLAAAEQLSAHKRAVTEQLSAQSSKQPPAP